MNLLELRPDRLREHRRPHRQASGDTAADALLRLWALRLLVPLAGWTRLADPARFAELDPGLVELLGLADLHGAAMPAAETLRSQLPARLHRAHAEAERDGKRPALPAALAANLVRLVDLMALSPVDAELVGFVVLLQGDGRLRAGAELLGMLSTDRVFAVLARTLDRPEAALREALATAGTLSRSGLLTLDRSQAGYLAGSLDLISYGFAQRMLAEAREPLDIFRDTIVPSSPPSLRLADYAHLDGDLAILRPYLRQSLAAGRSGVNVLIHGAPGTGKSQLARVLAADLGGALYEIASEDEEGDPSGGLQRLRALFAAQRLVGRRRALILFDEMEDVFHDGEDAGGRKSSAQLRKAWMNRMLEQNPVPTLWIGNRADGLDPAYIRRFDLVLELTVPPRRRREAMIRGVAGEWLDEGQLARLAASEQLAPAVLTRAAAVLACVGDALPAGERSAAYTRLVDRTLVAQGYRGLDGAQVAAGGVDYDASLVNCQADLTALAEGLAATRSGRLCLYGPPGTGKTAFARWLADRLDMPLHARAISDLVSPYVGETEQAIARCFRAAERDGAALLIDEVDGFLRDRAGAVRSWEVTVGGCLEPHKFGGSKWRRTWAGT